MRKESKLLHVYVALLFGWVFSLPLALAAKHSAAIDLKKLEKKYASVGSFEAEFTQEVYQATLARTKTSKGVIMLSKPLLVRWETLEPEKTILVSNGIKVWFFHPLAGGKQKGQVTVGPARNLASNALIGILNGTIAIDKEFTLQGKKPNADGESIVLVPKKRLGDIKEVSLDVNAKYLINQVKLSHNTGNTTTISLQNIKLGAKLPTNLFKFTPPVGVDVVEADK